jgi:RNA polymerase sigma factor (TIGR02999 family)
MRQKAPESVISLPAGLTGDLKSGLARVAAGARRSYLRDPTSRGHHMPARPSTPNSEPATDDRALDSSRAIDDLFNATYAELRRLASSMSRQEAGVTLSPTALVNEAWLKLSRSPELAINSRAHFRRVAARAMRQVLVEAARRRRAEKRGAGDAMVTFDEALHATASDAEELLALDEALNELARLHPRQAMMVESRFFGGLDVAETAALLDISEATVLRDWRAARAWLARELRH